jgi:putative ABC transport system permease protein
MNIMMVSVTERTREIGVRMAVGARRFDIMRQFLIEAAIISVLGGGLGVVFGMVLTDLLKNVTEELLSPYHSSGAMFWALGMAGTVGVISGLYPALRASRLDPVEALRYE